MPFWVRNKLSSLCVVRSSGACCSVVGNCWHGPLDPTTINVGPPPRNTQLPLVHVRLENSTISVAPPHPDTSTHTLVPPVPPCTTLPHSLINRLSTLPHQASSTRSVVAAGKREVRLHDPRGYWPVATRRGITTCPGFYGSNQLHYPLPPHFPHHPCFPE